MVRKGHKEGCQCAVCRRISAKIEKPEALVQQVEPEGITFASLRVGERFYYGNSIYRKAHQSGNAVDLTSGSDDGVMLPLNAIVKRL